MTAAAQTATPTLKAVPKAEAPAAMAQAAAEAETRIASHLLSTQRQLADMTLAFTNEVMGFATRRMQAQAAFVAQLTRCGDAADLLDTQLRFVAETTNDYAAEITTLAKVMQPQS